MDAERVQRAAIDHEAAERMVSLDRPLGITGFGLNQMRFGPGERWRVHRHAGQQEVYLVLRGTMTLLVDGEPERELREGDLASVPPEVRRQLVNRSATPATVLAIGAAGEHVGHDGEAFLDWDDPVGKPPREVPIPDALPVDGA